MTFWKAYFRFWSIAIIVRQLDMIITLAFNIRHVRWMKISCLPSTHNTLNSKQVNQKWIIYSSLCCSKPVWSSSAEHKRYFVQHWPSSNVDLNFMDTKPQWHNIFFCVRKRNSYFWVNSPFKTCRIIRHTQQAWTCLMYCHFDIELNHWI